jgi:enamine deaminase RidA (YjgF/YER057c/UK114 family)
MFPLEFSPELQPIGKPKGTTSEESMSGKIEQKLKEMGVILPDAPKPVASYVGFVRHADLVVVSGQLPFKDGKLSHTGLLGRDVSIEDAASAARQCAINLLSQVKAACDGDLDRIVRCIRLGGFVASTADFTDQPKVVNGASDFIGEALGAVGAHARAAVGVAALPLNACVEVEGLFAIR